MELIRVQDSDYRKTYELYMTFPENENGYMNSVYGCLLYTSRFLIEDLTCSKGTVRKEGAVTHLSKKFADADCVF